MNVRKIKEKNAPQFLEDMKTTTECLAFVGKTKAFLKVSKKTVYKEAETDKIEYYMTRDIYRVRRLVMVIV